MSHIYWALPVSALFGGIAGYLGDPLSLVISLVAAALLGVFAVRLDLRS